MFRNCNICSSSSLEPYRLPVLWSSSSADVKVSSLLEKKEAREQRLARKRLFRNCPLHGQRRAASRAGSGLPFLPLTVQEGASSKSALSLPFLSHKGRGRGLGEDEGFQPHPAQPGPAARVPFDNSLAISYNNKASSAQVAELADALG